MSLNNIGILGLAQSGASSVAAQGPRIGRVTEPRAASIWNEAAAWINEDPGTEWLGKCGPPSEPCLGVAVDNDLLCLALEGCIEVLSAHPTIEPIVDEG